MPTGGLPPNSVVLLYSRQVTGHDIQGESHNEVAGGALRILFLNQVLYPSQFGGTANTVHWLAKHLTRNGIHVTIVAGDKGLPETIERGRWIRSEAGDVIYLRNRFERSSMRQTIAALRQLSKTDVVHLSSIFYLPAFFTAIGAKVLRKKLVWSMHGEIDPPGLTISPRKKNVVLRLMNAVVNPSILFHSTCDTETKYIRERFGASTNVVQITNYLDVAPLVKKEDVEPYLFFVGRMSKKKRLENLMEALAINEAFGGSSVVLKVAGTGPAHYESELKTRSVALGLADKVEFLGEVVGEEKDRLYANAVCTIMPSATENFGLVVVESLAQNTPVIASTGSPWSIIEKEGLGYWVDNDPETLSSAITKMLSMSDAERRAMGSRGRDFVIRNFDAEANIREWMYVYREHLAGRTESLDGLVNDPLSATAI